MTTPEPLTPEEERDLRYLMRHADGFGDEQWILALLATLDAERAARQTTPCAYCGSVDGLTPSSAWGNDPLDATTIRRVTEESTDLINPRLSEVDWDVVASHWSIAVVRDYAESFGLRAARQTPDSGLREAAQAVVVHAEPDDNWDGEYVDFLVPAEYMAALRAALAAEYARLTAVLHSSPVLHPSSEERDLREWWGLDEAWAAAEAALPEGWGISLSSDADPPTRYRASAGRIEFEWPVRIVGPCFADTAAEALRALAARLTEDQP